MCYYCLLWEQYCLRVFENIWAKVEGNNGRVEIFCWA
jgi:hypothetical protein